MTRQQKAAFVTLLTIMGVELLLIAAKCLFLSFSTSRFVFVQWNRLLGTSIDISEDIIAHVGASQQSFVQHLTEYDEPKVAIAAFIVICFCSIIYALLSLKCIPGVYLILMVKACQILILGNLPFWDDQARLSSWALLCSFAIADVALIVGTWSLVMSRRKVENKFDGLSQSDDSGGVCI